MEYNAAGSGVEYSRSGLAQNAVKSAQPKSETLIDQFGRELGLIFDMIDRLESITDRIYGGAPKDKMSGSGAPTPVAFSILDRLQELAVARNRLVDAVSRLGNGF